MFVREKRINGYTYLYLVETVREHGRAKQRIIKNLGRKEALAGSGAPERCGVRWEETGCRAVIEGLLSGRGFEFAVERAVFATVLHRIMVSGSDRACEKWMAGKMRR